MESNPKYKRVLIKLSGEFLKDKESIISFEKLDSITSDLKEIQKKGVEIGLVVGGGNILRGLEGSSKYKISSAELDELGMAATAINGGAISLTLKKKKISNSVLSAIPISSSIGSKYSRDKAIDLLKKNHIVIFVGGTGNPFFTTDSAASLRAIEIGAELLIKATKVNGVYSDDPITNPSAVFYPRLSYNRVLDEHLAVMDATAVVLCRDHGMPIRVMNINEPGALMRLMRGEEIGSLVEGGD